MLKTYPQCYNSSLEFPEILNQASKDHVLSLTECVWDFLNNALWMWDIH